MSEKHLHYIMDPLKIFIFTRSAKGGNGKIFFYISARDKKVVLKRQNVVHKRQNKQ